MIASCESLGEGHAVANARGKVGLLIRAISSSSPAATASNSPSSRSGSSGGASPAWTIALVFSRSQRLAERHPAHLLLWLSIQGKPARTRTRACEVGARRAPAYTTDVRSGRPGSNGPPRSGAPVLFRLSYVRTARPAGFEPASSASAEQRSSTARRAFRGASGRSRTHTSALRRARACR